MDGNSSSLARTILLIYVIMIFLLCLMLLMDLRESPFAYAQWFEPDSYQFGRLYDDRPGGDPLNSPISDSPYQNGFMLNTYEIKNIYLGTMPGSEYVVPPVLVRIEPSYHSSILSHAYSPQPIGFMGMGPIYKPQGGEGQYTNIFTGTQQTGAWNEIMYKSGSIF